MLAGALLTIMMGTAALEASDRITCDFARLDSDRASLNVELRPTPSLRDKPGLFRLQMQVGARAPVQATAQPIDTTEDRDISVTAKGAGDLFYALGVNHEGRAALNIRMGGTTASETLFGTCNGITKHMDRWLPE